MWLKNATSPSCSKALHYLLLNSFFVISDKNGIQKLNSDQSATFTIALSTMFSEYFQ